MCGAVVVFSCGVVDCAGVVACVWLCWFVDVIVGCGVRCGVVVCVWLAVLSVVCSCGVVLACVGVIGCC